MEKIVYNLVRNLLIVKHGFKDKYQNNIEHIHCVKKTNEYELICNGLNVVFITKKVNLPLIITSDERKENKPNKVAIKYFKQLDELLRN
ncbi:hypothetical protein [Acinetobacter baumannii]|uniref:hypothetical protein n=1 Tax=Acinetobacter baumannii TaxID=470 RepID=UPI002340DAF0|nr:hypothetical protein [Acinetobacter baumannii]MDC4147479.1 hypothetical protein [Acinetobacter baumannii]